MSAPACNRFEWLLPALLDGDGDAARHLDECVACREAHAGLRGLLEQLPVALPVGPVPDLRERVRRRIDRLPQASPSWLRRNPWAPAALIAACLVVAVMVPVMRSRVPGGHAAPLSAASAATSSNTVAAAFDDALMNGLSPDYDSSDLTGALLESVSPSSDDL